MEASPSIITSSGRIDEKPAECSAGFLFCWLHHLDKAEHLVRPLVGIVILILLRHFMIGPEILPPKLIDLKAAFVDVKMDITLLEIRRTGLPNHSFGVQSLNLQPRAVCNTDCQKPSREN